MVTSGNWTCWSETAGLGQAVDLNVSRVVVVVMPAVRTLVGGIIFWLHGNLKGIPEIMHNFEI
jgi:hypothetical protein